LQFDTTPIISSSEISSSLVKGWLESKFFQVVEEGLVLPDGGEDLNFCSAEEVMILMAIFNIDILDFVSY